MRAPDGWDTAAIRLAPKGGGSAPMDIPRRDGHQYIGPWEPVNAQIVDTVVVWFWRRPWIFAGGDK